MILYYIILPLLALIIGLIVYFGFKRNYFNKYKYIRLVTYNDDMSVSVRYIKENYLTKMNLY